MDENKLPMPKREEGREETKETNKPLRGEGWFFRRRVFRGLYLYPKEKAEPIIVKGVYPYVKYPEGDFALDPLGIKVDFVIPPLHTPKDTGVRDLFSASEKLKTRTIPMAFREKLKKLKPFIYSIDYYLSENSDDFKIKRPVFSIKGTLWQVFNRDELIKMRRYKLIQLIPREVFENLIHGILEIEYTQNDINLLEEIQKTFPQVIHIKHFIKGDMLWFNVALSRWRDKPYVAPPDSNTLKRAKKSKKKGTFREKLDLEIEKPSYLVQAAIQMAYDDPVMNFFELHMRDLAEDFWKKGLIKKCIVCKWLMQRDKLDNFHWQKKKGHSKCLKKRDYEKHKEIRTAYYKKEMRETRKLNRSNSSPS